MDPVLEAARSPDGSKRFYPPGEHPAVYKWRISLKRIEEMGLGDSPEAHSIRNKIAEFEDGESVAKVNYLMRWQRAHKLD